MSAPIDARPTPHDPRISAARAQIESMLVPGEVIEAMAVQHRLFALMQRRIVVAATSGRLLSISRGLIAGFKPLDIRWQDLQDASVHVGMFGTRLTLQVSGASPSSPARTVVFEGLQKDGAQNVYRICEAQEQAWREKRRVRELEEMRAKAGGVSIGQHGFQAHQDSPVSGDDPATRLEKAKAMFDKGLITDAEFETIKAKVINSL